MNEIEREDGEGFSQILRSIDCSTSGTLLIYPISRTRGRSQGWIRLLAKAKGPLPLLCFLLRGREIRMTRLRKESIERTRCIDLLPLPSFFEIRPRGDLSLEGNCIRITSCHSRYHIQPSSSSS